MPRPTSLHSLLVAIGVVVATVASPAPTLAAGRPDAAAVPPQEFAVGDPAYFEVPSPIPAGAHGDLIRWQLVETTFDTFYRIMYLSETVGGAPTVVTAVLVAPEEEPAFGGFPLLIHGHGGLGLADQCAPSRAVDADDDTYAQEFAGLASSATTDGFVVVSTDYEGLGGPGRHPFLVGISGGRSLLDAGLAARQLPVVYIGSVTMLLGFSQGGHAALWATQLAPEYTPQQPITGTVVAAPGSEVAQLARAGVADPNRSVQTVAILAGLAAAHPEAEAALPNVLTPAGLQLVTYLDERCFEDDGFDEGLPPPPYLLADPTTVEPFASLLAANTPGAVASPTPILMFQSDADLNVPLADNDALLARQCASGQVVERRILADSNHAVVGTQSNRPGLDWLLGLSTGTPAISSCLS